MLYYSARDRGLGYVDATCPLVSKVHRQAERLIEDGMHILFIGQSGHPEVIGTFGQVPEGSMTLVETVADAEAVEVADPERLAFLTQTTLSVDDTTKVLEALKARKVDAHGWDPAEHSLREFAAAGFDREQANRLEIVAGKRGGSYMSKIPARKMYRLRAAMWLVSNIKESAHTRSAEYLVEVRVRLRVAEAWRQWLRVAIRSRHKDKLMLKAVSEILREKEEGEQQCRVRKRGIK